MADALPVVTVEVKGSKRFWSATVLVYTGVRVIGGHRGVSLCSISDASSDSLRIALLNDRLSSKEHATLELLRRAFDDA